MEKYRTVVVNFLEGCSKPTTQQIALMKNGSQMGSVRVSRTSKDFFLFYCLNPTWFKVCGSKYYKVNEFQIYNKLSIDKIDDIYSRIVFRLTEKVLSALEKGINSESKYVFGNYGHKYYGVGKYERMCVKKELNIPLTTKPEDVSMDIKRRIFMMDIWHDFFGGEAWKIACDLYSKLEKAYTNYNFKDMVYYLDGIFDHEHNTGSILNKDGDFYFLTPNVLNWRAEAPIKAYDGFLKLFPRIKKIIKRYDTASTV